MPTTLKQYVHRVGRTARAGRVGRSVSLVGESERKILKEIVASNKGGSLKQRLISAGQFFNFFKLRCSFRNTGSCLRLSIEFQHSNSHFFFIKSRKRLFPITDVIKAYKNRIEGLEESIKRIGEEEEAERTLRLAQEELQRGKAKLEGNVEKRHWMKSQKPLISEKGRIYCI